MTRSVKVLVSSVLGAAMLVSVSSMALAQSPTKDTVIPSDVEKLSITSGDGQATLEWQPATDNVGVKGYSIYYGNEEVKTTNTATYSTTIDAGNVTKYTVKNLTNGKKYFFAVTAYDAAKNESENYSPYLSAVPMAKVMADAMGGPVGDSTIVAQAATDDEEVKTVSSDTTAPTVSNAEALNKNQVRVTFSEVITLPTQDAEKAFTVQDNYTYEILKVKSVALDLEDLERKSVILETEEQNPQSEYIVTAGIQIEDVAGNPINSGTSDTAPFTGSSMTKEEYAKLHPSAPVVDPTKSASDEKPLVDDSKIIAATTVDAQTAGDFAIASVAAENDTTLKVSFSKPAVFSIDPSENFEIYKKGNESAPLELSLILLDDNKQDVLITTSTMEPNVEYTVKVKNVVDSTGKSLALGKDTYDFMSVVVAPPADTTPPEDVTNLVVKAIYAAQDLGAKLQWTGSKNSAGDLLSYVIYHSTDDKNYGQLTTLAKENTAYEATELQPGMNYFRVTAKDENGNESAGKVVKINLAETGPELGLFALASVGLGRLFGRKKKQK